MPGGRPSKIDTVIGERDGTPITVAERIVQQLTIGNFFEPSCLATGIPVRTAYEWRRIAGVATIREAGKDEPTYTDHEERCIEFSRAVEEAESRWEVSANADLERLGRGNIRQETTTTVTKTYADGTTETTTTVKVEHSLPNPQVLEWRLTRHFPERYRESVEVRQAGGDLTVEERAAALVDNLSQYLTDVDAAASARGNGKANGRRDA